MQLNLQKNILVLHGSSDLYGASKIFLITVEALAAAGYQVHVVLSEDGPLVNELRPSAASISIIKLGILRKKYFNVPGLLNRIKTVRFAYKALCKIVKDKNIDIIYSNTLAVLVGTLVARKMKKKHVWHVHEIIQSPKIFVRLMGILLKKSDLVIAVSNEVKKHWSKAINKPSLNFKTIYNGLDYTQLKNVNSTLRDELKVDPTKRLVGMIGRVNSWKGQKYFIEIAKLLNEKVDNLHFVMVGDAYPGYEFLYGELAELKDKYNISAHISDLGFRKDIPNILSGLDVFILPSILPDPLPTVILEAMASDKVVIATGHGGALEMIKENETGFFIPWDDKEKAAGIIADVLINKDIKQLGINGGKRVNEFFSIEAYRKNILTEIESL